MFPVLQFKKTDSIFELDRVSYCIESFNEKIGTAGYIFKPAVTIRHPNQFDSPNQSGSPYPRVNATRPGSVSLTLGTRKRIPEERERSLIFTNSALGLKYEIGLTPHYLLNL